MAFQPSIYKHCTRNLNNWYQRHSKHSNTPRHQGELSWKSISSIMLSSSPWRRWDGIGSGPESYSSNSSSFTCHESPSTNSANLGEKQYTCNTLSIYDTSVISYHSFSMFSLFVSSCLVLKKCLTCFRRCLSTWYLIHFLFPSRISKL